MDKPALHHGLQAHASAKLSLTLLCAQNVASLLLLHALQAPSHDQHHPRFNLVTAVLLSELLKLLTSLLINLHHKSFVAADLLRHHSQAILPAALYTAAILCQSFAARRLDLAVYVILSQLKLLFTPVFSTLLLRQEFTRQNWACLTIMAGGMCLVQLGAKDVPARGGGVSGFDVMMGVAAMALAGMLVAFAGVYLEAKTKSARRFWVLQSQLSAYSAVAALLVWAWQKRTMTGVRDEAEVLPWDMDPLGWAFVALQVMGGPLVGWCLAVTSSTAKNYAQGMGFLVATAVGFLKAVGPRRTPVFFWGMGMLLGSICWSIWMNIRVGREGSDKEEALLPKPNAKEADL